MPTNLSTLDFSQIQSHLKNNSLKIGVVGIGRIGLPTALCIANSGLDTIGIDINKNLVDMVNSNNYPLKDEPEFDKIFDNVISQKKLSATTDIVNTIPKCDIVILSLPTPMDNHNIPDYGALLTVGRSLNKLLSNGQIVIVESTVEPGFIENELLQSIEGENRSIKSGIDPTDETIEGNPDARASIKEFGIPSCHDGNIKISLDLKFEITWLSFNHPVIVILSYKL